MDCYDTALRYRRSVFNGKPIAGFQHTKKLAEMITEITKAQLLTFRLGHSKMKPPSAQISMAKRNNVDMAIHIAREARQMLGEWASLETSIMRHMMNQSPSSPTKERMIFTCSSQGWILLERTRSSKSRRFPDPSLKNAP